MRVLAIEASCDDTAASVIENGRTILSNVVASQIDLHAAYGGVFPEMASRAHIEAIVPVVQAAMREACLGFDDLDGVAVTHGPGLAGSLLVGVNAAKGIALGRGLPLVGINHLEAHIYAHWLDAPGEGMAPPAAHPEDERLAFPLVAFVISGGHTELILMRGHGDYRYLGGTIDDAAGEAFDKVARLLGLSFPGGPSIQRASQNGDASAFHLPRAWLEEDGYDFSFSGLKTAVLRIVEKYRPPLSAQLVADLAAAFQDSVVDVLTTKAARAAEEFGARAVLLCGGVSANVALRQEARRRASVPVYYPPLVLCTDNAAMVGACAYRYLLAGRVAGWDLDVLPGLRLG